MMVARMRASRHACALVRIVPAVLLSASALNAIAQSAADSQEAYYSMECAEVCETAAAYIDETKVMQSGRAKRAPAMAADDFDELFALLRRCHQVAASERARTKSVISSQHALNLLLESEAVERLLGSSHEWRQGSVVASPVVELPRASVSSRSGLHSETGGSGRPSNHREEVLTVPMTVQRPKNER